MPYALPIRERPVLGVRSALAVVGFAVVLALHVRAWLGKPLEHEGPWLVLLFAGLLTTLAPSLRRSNRAGRRFDPVPHWPFWARRVVAVLAAYCVLNFVVWFALCITYARGGGPHALPDGRYILGWPTRIVRVISADQYRLWHAREQRFFTGHFLLFYGLGAFTALYPPAPTRARRKLTPAAT